MRKGPVARKVLVAGLTVAAAADVGGGPCPTWSGM